MKNYYKKGLLISTIVIVLIFSWLWTEGFGYSNKYPHGNTIEEALIDIHDIGIYPGKLTNIIHAVDIEENKKLVFYERDNNTLGCELLRKKWNNKWFVLSSGLLELPLEAPAYKGEDKLKVGWGPYDVNEFHLNVGVVYDKNIEKVQIAGKDAVMIGKGSDIYFWYFIDKIKSSLGSDKPYMPYKPLYDVKAYDKNNNLVYSYYKKK